MDQNNMNSLKNKEHALGKGQQVEESSERPGVISSRRARFLQNEKRVKTTPKKLKQSIKLDPVNPSDFLNYTFLHSCEQCSHWISDNGLCSLGYKNDIHRLESNLKSYELNGKMAFCRLIEID